MIGRHGPFSRLLSTLLLCALISSPTPGPAAELPEHARWLQDYLRIDTTNPPAPGRDGEARAAGYLADILHREGIATRRLVSPEGRTSLYARLEADRPDEQARDHHGGALILMHHMDVVPAGEGWTVEPFAAEIVDGRLVGRGAIDVKSLGIAHLVAFIDLHRRKVPLGRDVIFLAVADEERGGLQGTKWLLERHGDLLEGASAVLGEGGLNKEAAGRALWAGIEIAQKRPLWLRAVARGRGGHGSILNPRSANHELIAGLARILDLKGEYRVTQAARTALAALGTLRGREPELIYTDPAAVVAPEGPREEIRPPLHSLFLDTVQVTVLEGGEKINVVPAEAAAEIDVRLLPDTDAQAFLDRLREAAGDTVRLEVVLTAPPAPPSPVDHPVYRAAAEVLGETAPVVPAFIPGFTDSRYFRERGIPAYGVSPFFLGPYEATGIHGPDEGIPLDEFGRGVERMKRIVERVAAR